MHRKALKKKQGFINCWREKNNMGIDNLERCSSVNFKSKTAQKARNLRAWVSIENALIPGDQKKCLLRTVGGKDSPRVQMLLHRKDFKIGIYFLSPSFKSCDHRPDIRGQAGSGGNRWIRATLKSLGISRGSVDGGFLAQLINGQIAPPLWPLNASKFYALGRKRSRTT